MSSMSSVDCVIIGAGPAGLSAAVQARREGLSVALVEKALPGGQALAALCIENYPGIPEGISGKDLMARFSAQTRAHGVAIIPDEVRRVEREDRDLAVFTGHAKIVGRSIIVACGLKPKMLGVPGEARLVGTRIYSYVDPSTIDHYGGIIAVIGSGDAAFDQALNFAGKAQSVNVLVKHDSARCARHLIARAIERRLEVKYGCRVVSFEEMNGRLCIRASVEGSGTITIEADAAVVCAGKKPCDDFIDRSSIDANMPRIFWAGDAARGRMGHIAMAAGEGVAAASAAANSLRNDIWK